MTVELTNKEVKCRKRHRCVWCGEWLEPGDSAHYRVGIYDDFFHEYWHLECMAAVTNSDLSADDYYYPYDQKRGKTYEESHP